MEFKLRTEIQLMLVLLFAAASLVGLSVALGGVTPSLAQGPATATPLQLVITDEDLAAFGLPANAIHASDVVTFDLQVVKSTSATSVTAGTTVNYTIVITNHGQGTAQGVIFQDVPPNQMVNINYTFSPGMSAISNGATIPSQLKWLLLNGIPINQSTKITVTGQLTSALSLTVTNTAMITTYNPAAEAGSQPNTASVGVWVTGDSSAVGRIIYLPYVSKMPTPTPSPTPPVVLAYYENFDSGTPWPRGDLGNGCTATHTGGIYQVDQDKSRKECLPAAPNKNKPESPLRTYGEFEVTGYISGEGQDPDHSYGIWLNGAGGDTQYVFRIYPNIGGCSNGGKWEFLRRKPGANATLASNNCDTHIKRGYSSSVAQTIRVGHKSNGQITLYIDGTLIQTITDNNQITNGSATGVYVRSDDANKVRVKFDDFRVYKYP